MEEKILSEKIKTVGFIMTCFIVFYHCNIPKIFYTNNIFDNQINIFLFSFFEQMGIFAMSFFFAVTGFLLFNNLNKKNYYLKIKRRIFSLLIPYILWQVIFTIVKLILYKKFSLLNFLYSTFCFVQWPIDGALWYVYAVFILAIFSPLLLLVFNNKFIGCVFILIVILLLYISKSTKIQLFYNIISYGYIPNILYYLPSYIIGCFYGRFYNELNKENYLIYIFLILFIIFLLDKNFEGILNETVIKIIPIAILFLLPTIPFFKDKKIYRLNFLIYAIHQPFILVITQYINIFYRFKVIPISIMNISIRVMILAFIILIADIIYFTLNKLHPRILKLLTGGRK